VIPGHDPEPEIEALQVDRYLESILNARERGSVATPYDPGLDPQLRAVAGRLSAELVRVHPSFRFEERLGRLLAAQAASQGLPVAAGAESSLPVPLGPGRLGDLVELAGLGDEDSAGRARPYLIGGAITSAALSLAGAAYVAWRLSRPIHPMVRAIRTVHDQAARESGLA
jgi:hypothetical protein